MPTAAADFALLERFWRDAPERSVLPNGVTVLLQHDSRAAVVSAQVWVRTGSIHEGSHLGAGLSHFLEHMLFKGTERRSGRELSTTVQAHGGYINAYTCFDRTVYHVDIPAEHTPVALDVLADAVLHSTLPPDEVTRERDVILREIDMGRDDPDNRLSETLFATAFREHPYRHPVIGHRELLSAVTRDQLWEYYRARYVPNNLVVILAGAFEPAAVHAAIAESFGAAPRAPLPPVYLPDEPRQQARRTRHLFEDVQLSRTGMGWQIPGLTHPDSPALDLLATVLGGGDSSVLWQSVRERARLVHTIDAHAWNPGSVGLFFVSYTSEPGKRDRAAGAVEREIARRARSGFPRAEIARALRQLVVGEINTRKTMAGQAARLGLAEVVVGDLDYSRTYFGRLRDVTSGALAGVIRRHLVPDHLTTVSLDPVAARPADAALGAASRPPALPDFEATTLANGARFLLQRDTGLPNVHLRLAFQGGPLFEPADRRGATALLATLLTKDTRVRSAAEVARAIEAVGGSFYPFSGNNSFGLALEVLPSDLDRALELLADAILTPVFKRATFDTERAAQLAELQEDADDVVAFGRKRLRRIFFGDHPFAVDAAGDEAGLQAMAPADVAALHRQLVRAGNAVLAVAGDLVPKHLAPRLRRFLGRLPTGSAAGASGAWPRSAGAGDHRETQPRHQAVVFQAFPGPGLLDPDFPASEVADELFSGMSSRLFERVREQKGLAYFVRSARVVGLAGAMFYFYAGTDPAQADAVRAEIEAEIARVQAGGVDAAELDRCRTRLKAARRMGFQTNSARAMQAALDVLYGLPANDWKQYEPRIDAVTLPAVQRFAAAYFQPSVRTRLVVRP